MPGKFKHGFAVIGAQPYHIGHDRLVKEMLDNCENATIVISSAQEVGTLKNPLPYHLRKKMIQNVYRGTEDYSKLWILGVNDTPDVLSWPQNVLAAISTERQDIPSPDVFYGGSPKDYAWFKNDVANFVLCDRTSQSFPFLSGSMVRDMIHFGDARWRNFVHEVNFELIEKHFIGQ